MIGMEERCEQLESLLSIGSANTRIISLFGMGGIGKTTLANAVYGRIFSHFESCCFLKNVREESERVYDGLEELRKKLFAKLLGEKTVDLETPSSLEIIKMRLRKIRVLIVLDDVSKSKQLEHLVGDGDCFASGSRILLTTREQKVLRTIRRNNGVETHEDEVKQLSDSEALDLFNFTAFDERKPPSEYVELSKEAVRYAGCIPLAIKVVGSELRSLREPNEKKWEKALKIFKMSPPTDISEVLKISYEGLKKDEKNIFLDIACFFKGKRRDFVENILNARNFSANIGIDNLIDKSLITIDPQGNKLQMHDLVQDIGRDIVCQESENPAKRSRLWIAEDIIKVLKKNVGTENIQGIFMDYSEIDEDIHLEPTIFGKMSSLRLLKIVCHHYLGKERGMYLQQGLQCLPNSLRYLEWEAYPLESLPPNFKPKNLVELKMKFSELEQLWDGGQVLKKLKGIDLRFSHKLTRIPDVSASPDLERINLEGCKFLREIPYSRIQQNLNNLIDVNFRCCDSLRKVPDRILDAASLRTLSLSPLNLLPTVITSTSLESLNLCSSFNPETSSVDNCERLSNLSGLNNLNSLRGLSFRFCPNLKKLPVLPSNIEKLHIGEMTIEELDFQSIEDLKLEKLCISDCISLKSLPPRIFELRFLRDLSLFGCTKLKNLPDIPKPMESLTDICINEINIRKLPSSFGNLIGLRSLRARSCRYLKFDPEIIFNMPKLADLKLVRCPELRSFSFAGVDLENIDVGHSYIKKIPESIKDASKLRMLELTDCSDLRSIPALPLSLEYLDARGCTLLEEVSISEGALTQELENNYPITKNTSIFYNCSKLGQKALDNIITEFQRRVLRMATRFASLGHQEENLQVCTCCPGNEIPEWFDHQAEGCRIEFPLPHNNFLGFVLCAVGNTYDRYGDIYMWLNLVCELKLKTNQEEKYNCIQWDEGYSAINLGMPFGSVSDHLYMWFEPQHYSEYNYTDGVSVSFAFSFVECKGRENHGIAPPHFKVKKCGIHVLYSKDLKKCNLTPSQAKKKARNKSAATLDKPKS